MRTLCFLLIIWAAGVAMVRAEDKPLAVVDHVDLERYLGTWYEIATIPQRFQKGCVAVTATYSFRPDGKIRVINRCRKETLDGKVKEVEGKAWIVDPTTNAKLKVQFFWPFSGAYWIIELDPDYQWAVVGHPNRNYLWILSRTPKMDPGLYQNLLGRVLDKGYDLSRIKLTLQPSE